LQAEGFQVQDLLSSADKGSRAGIRKVANFVWIFIAAGISMAQTASKEDTRMRNRLLQHFVLICQKAWKGWSMVHPYSQSVSDSLHSPGNMPHEPHLAAEMAYQGLTILAMLFVLGSLWVF
jgi:hypothetical protein